ncbi:hypothetical protein KC332_g12844 [Hortaea werneckii]|nr:hypothetical protein KC358_g12765 [Hortaea werneckii]KAI6810631.1 hypothetical protein KC350_g12459 [Hortaea werneckii]KAI6911640.1 hypothetical protein KC348_g12902 [Hortaea werneckii]KAI6926831.1 hypothetical protein KC341_g12543 [Hortaea werneckii]KAI6960699.1 hypothetical protein KC321_g12713 [Hortaea werneckii]
MAMNVFSPWMGADLCDPLRDHKLQAVPWGADTKTLVGELYAYVTLARVSINIGRNITQRAEGWMQVGVERLLFLLELGVLPTVDEEAKAVRNLLNAGQLLSDEAGWHLYRLAWYGSAQEQKGRVYYVRERELQLLHKSRELLQADNH